MVKATLTVLFLLGKMHHCEFCLIRFILDLITFCCYFCRIVQKSSCSDIDMDDSDS